VVALLARFPDLVVNLKAHLFIVSGTPPHLRRLFLKNYRTLVRRPREYRSALVDYLRFLSLIEEHWNLIGSDDRVDSASILDILCDSVLNLQQGSLPFLVSGGSFLVFAVDDPLFLRRKNTTTGLLGLIEFNIKFCVVYLLLRSVYLFQFRLRGAFLFYQS